VGVNEDIVSERAVLSGICKHGSEAYFDVVDLLQPSTFTSTSNKILFECIQHIFKNNEQSTIDIPSIFAAAQSLNLYHVINTKGETEYIHAVLSCDVDLKNVRQFAGKIRKLEITRLLRSQLKKADKSLVDVTGDENITSILGIAEDAVFDFTSLLNENEEKPTRIGDGLTEYMDHLVANPVKQIGLSTGFAHYDEAIGGGLRPGTINMIAARPKVGKTILGNNIGYNVSKKIPVLNMDTEMSLEDHRHRTLARMTKINIGDIETGQFAQTPDQKEKVYRAIKFVEESVNYHHKSIAGTPFEEQIGIMRRWLVKEVGLNDDGTAKDCLIVYDYLKLMDAKGISQDLKEYQLLGFYMSTLHNFAVRFKIPILAFMQLNRDGITKEGTESASGSDRIIWLCSNFTIFKNKSDEEVAADGNDAGNRKLVPVVTRHGPGMEFGNYINVDMMGWCARIEEKKTRQEITQTNKDINQGFESTGGGNESVEFN